MKLRRIFSGNLSLLLVLNLVFLPSAWGDETLFNWPVRGRVAVRYRQKYFNVENGKEYTHHGIDIQVPTDTEVVAAGDGKVSFTGFTPAGGNTIAIIHPNGYKTTYLQLAQISVSKGEAVGKGQKIATVAASGDKSLDRPHLHFGVREIATGNYVDPESLLPSISLDTNSSDPRASESLATGNVSSSASYSLAADNSLVTDTNPATQLLKQADSSPALSKAEGPVLGLSTTLNSVEGSILEQGAVPQSSEVELLREFSPDLKYGKLLSDLYPAALFEERLEARMKLSENRSLAFSEVDSEQNCRESRSLSESNSEHRLPQGKQSLLPFGCYQILNPLIGSYPGFGGRELMSWPLGFSKHNENLYPLPGKEVLEVSLILVAFSFIVVLAVLAVRRLLNWVQCIACKGLAYRVQHTV